MENGIVIVDDMPMIRRHMRRILNAANLPVLAEAENGRAALQQISFYKPALCILDIVMPVMDGISVLEKLGDNPPASRILVCSALDDEKLILRAIALGAVDYIIKPFAEERFLKAVKKALEYHDY